MTTFTYRSSSLLFYGGGSFPLCYFSIVNLISSQVNTEEALKRKERETPRDRELCSYGFKFEQYMSVSRPGAAQSASDTGQPVNENTEFCCIFRTRLGQVNKTESKRGFADSVLDPDPEPVF
jgi:hypothetical protein